MSLLEYYFNAGVGGLTITTILPVTQWKVNFVSGFSQATGSSTDTTTTEIFFVNPLNTGPKSAITALTTSTSTENNNQQYPAGAGNGYFSPLIGNTLEEIVVYIQNAAGVTGNYVIFAIEIDLDGDFDE
jgi:hypothetical protein